MVKLRIDVSICREVCGKHEVQRGQDELTLMLIENNEARRMEVSIWRATCGELESRRGSNGRTYIEDIVE